MLLLMMMKKDDIAATTLDWNALTDFVFIYFFVLFNCQTCVLVISHSCAELLNGLRFLVQKIICCCLWIASRSDCNAITYVRTLVESNLTRSTDFVFFFGHDTDKWTRLGWSRKLSTPCQDFCNTRRNILMSLLKFLTAWQQGIFPPLVAPSISVLIMS